MKLREPNAAPDIHSTRGGCGLATAPRRIDLSPQRHLHHPPPLHDRGDDDRRSMIGPLQRYNHVTILRVHEGFCTRQTVVDVHFAFM